MPSNKAFPRQGQAMRILRLAGAAALALGCAACDPKNDPLVREGLFVPGHTNRQNLTLQVANPADLTHGTGQKGGDGQLAAAAVERLRTDKVKKLPAADLAQITAQNSGENNGQSGGGGQ